MSVHYWGRESQYETKHFVPVCRIIAHLLAPLSSPLSEKGREKDFIITPPIFC